MNTLLTLLTPLIVGHAEVGPGIHQVDLLMPDKTLVVVIAREEPTYAHYHNAR